MSAHPIRPLRAVKQNADTLTPIVDPAGLDKVLLAAGKAAHDFVMGKAARFGIRLDWWSGENGLEAVIQDAIREHEIPNKRFPELVSPRSIAERAGVVKPKKQKRRIAR